MDMNGKVVEFFIWSPGLKNALNIHKPNYPGGRRRARSLHNLTLKIIRIGAVVVVRFASHSRPGTAT